MRQHFKQTLIDTLIFNGCYFVLFALLINTFSDGGQTSATFMLIDLFLIFIVSVYFFIFTLIVQGINQQPGIFLKACVFFVLAELAALTTGGELPFFGLMQRYVYNEGVTSSFRVARDVAFSVAGLISALLFFVIRRWTKL